MSLSLPTELAVAVAYVAVPAATISALAYVCVNRRALRQFVYSVLLLTIVTAIAVVTALRWLQPYHVPASLWHDFIGALVSWAPIVILPSALVLVCVTGSISKHWIPVLATVGVLVSLPIGFILGLMIH